MGRTEPRGGEKIKEELRKGENIKVSMQGVAKPTSHQPSTSPHRHKRSGHVQAPLIRSTRAGARHEAF